MVDVPNCSVRDLPFVELKRVDARPLDVINHQYKFFVLKSTGAVRRGVVSTRPKRWSKVELCDGLNDSYFTFYYDSFERADW